MLALCEFISLYNLDNLLVLVGFSSFVAWSTQPLTVLLSPPAVCVSLDVCVKVLYIVTLVLLSFQQSLMNPTYGVIIIHLIILVYTVL